MNLQIKTRNTRSFVTKVVEKCICKNTIFGVSMASINVWDSFDKKTVLFFANLQIRRRNTRTFVTKLWKKSFYKHKPFQKKKLNISIFSELSTQNKKHTNFRYKSCRKSFSTYTTFGFPCPKENE